MQQETIVRLLKWINTTISNGKGIIRGAYYRVGYYINLFKYTFF